MDFTCKMCGSILKVDYHSYIAQCEFCGARQTYSRTKNDMVIGLYVHANQLRQNCRFDKAEETFRIIQRMAPEDPEGYWGSLMCNFGIEYVKDPSTGRYIPTCHRTMFESALEQEDYLKTLEHSGEEEKEFYRAEIDVIERIRERILMLASGGLDYDAFICYKETDENGERTEDSLIAEELYRKLEEKGVLTFYASKTLEDKLGTEYEPYIFAALNSSENMVVLGTKKDYFEAVWVRNEWSRYLKLMKKDINRFIYPCFKDMDVYDIPNELVHYQALDLNSPGAIDLLVEQIASKAGESRNKVISMNVDIFPELNKEPDFECGEYTFESLTDNSMKKAEWLSKDLNTAFFVLAQRNFKKAQQLFYDLIIREPDNGYAYIGRMMVELKIPFIADLGSSMIPLEDSSFFKPALEHADAAWNSRLNKTNEALKLRRRSIMTQKGFGNREHTADEAQAFMYERAISMLRGAKNTDEVRKARMAIEQMKFASQEQQDELIEKCDLMMKRAKAVRKDFMDDFHKDINYLDRDYGGYTDVDD